MSAKKLRLAVTPALIIAVSLLYGCAATETKSFVPLEPATIAATPAEVQDFIQTLVASSPKYSKFTVASETETTLELKTLCTNVMNAFKCAGVMMAIGNSGWDGPYAVETFYTLPVRGKTSLRWDEKFCATNMAGHTNCQSTSNNEERNKVAAAIARGYEAKFGSSAPDASEK